MGRAATSPACPVRIVEFPCGRILYEGDETTARRHKYAALVKVDDSGRRMVLSQNPEGDGAHIPRTVGNRSRGTVIPCPARSTGTNRFLSLIREENPCRKMHHSGQVICLYRRYSAVAALGSDGVTDGVHFETATNLALSTRSQGLFIASD